MLKSVAQGKDSNQMLLSKYMTRIKFTDLYAFYSHIRVDKASICRTEGDCGNLPTIYIYICILKQQNMVCTPKQLQHPRGVSQVSTFPQLLLYKAIIALSYSKLMESQQTQASNF